MFGGASRCHRSAAASVAAASAARAALPHALLIARPPRRRRGRQRRQVRAAQHVVEGADVARSHLADLRLRFLQPILQILVHGHLLIGRLEVAAGQPVPEVTEFLDQLRSEPDAVLAAAGAGPVYRLLGKKGLGTAEYPAPETALDYVFT